MTEMTISLSPDRSPNIVGPHRAVVVGRDANVVATLQTQLESLGHDVCGTATTLSVAKAMIRECRANLIVVDARDSTIEQVHEIESVPIARVNLAETPTDRELNLLLANARLSMEYRDQWARNRLSTAALDLVADGVIFTDGRGRVVAMNVAAERFTGWTRADALDRAIESVLNLIEPATGEPVEVPLRRALLDQNRSHVVESRIAVARSGEQWPVDVAVTPEFDSEGSTVGGTAVIRHRPGRTPPDIHAALFHHSPDAIVVFSANGTVQSLNPAAFGLYGYKPEEILGQSVMRFVDDVHRAPFETRLNEVAAGAPSRPLELMQQRRDGQPIEVGATIVAIRDEAGNCTDFAMMNRDLAPIRLLQAQFRQAQRMEAIGLLAGGVVHDFNNLLTVISGYSNMLIEELSLSEETREFAEEIRSAGERAANLTRQLNAYTRRQFPKTEPVNLNDVVERSKKLLQRLIGENIAMELRLDAAIRPVRADRAQLEQVLMNLVVNARDAMPTGGRLTVETAIIESPTGPSESEAAPPSIRLRVSDTGTGMPPEIRDRIFEPLFTTKEVGKGTGLGLAMVYGFVTACGGTVSVASEIGTGTTFMISLPVDPEPHVAPPASGSSSSAQPRGSETVLVVEDDASVRLFACTALRARGYTVLEAGNADEALGIVDVHGSTIALLVTDIVLPGMDGPGLAQAVLGRFPAVRILLATGYHDGRMELLGDTAATHARIHKPYSIAELAAGVRRVLDGGP